MKKIENINKRLVAGTVICSLLPSIFTGCSSLKIYQDDKKTNNITSEISLLDKFKRYYYVEIENTKNDEIECYVVTRSEFIEGGKKGYSYLDLQSNKKIYDRDYESYDYYYWTPDETNRKFITEIQLEDYLYDMGLIKGNLNDDDITYILEEMKKINDDKKLVKE